MKEEYQKILTDRKESKIDLNATIKKLKRVNRKNLDGVFHEQHETVFKKIDCLDCANCCKTTSPIFRDSDIKKLSKRFRVKTHEFINSYLKLDLDGDYVLRTAPCPFLWEDDNNKCSIYEDRPLACKEYPHTNRKNMYQILDLTKKNTEICPAVCNIIENIEANFETKTIRKR